MLSMRTKTTVVWAKAIPFPLLALSTFVVLTSRAVFGAHPEVLQPRTGLASGGFLPPGIDMVKFCVDYDAVYSVEKFVYGPENQLECASVFWPNLGSFAAISGPNDAVVLPTRLAAQQTPAARVRDCPVSGNTRTRSKWGVSQNPDAETWCQKASIWSRETRSARRLSFEDSQKSSKTHPNCICLKKMRRMIVMSRSARERPRTCDR